jgi:adenine deaminase
VNLARKRRLVFFLVGFFIGAMARAEDVDLLLTNGTVYTVNNRQPHAEAIAVKNGRVVFVGSNKDAKKFHAAKVVDLRGRTVVPASLIRIATFSGLASAKCD